MTQDGSSKITTKLSDKKWILGILGLVLIFSAVLVVAIIFFGAWAGDPRGETIPPGP